MCLSKELKDVEVNYGKQNELGLILINVSFLYCFLYLLIILLYALTTAGSRLAHNVHSTLNGRPGRWINVEITLCVSKDFPLQSLQYYHTLTWIFVWIFFGHLVKYFIRCKENAIKIRPSQKEPWTFSLHLMLNWLVCIFFLGWSVQFQITWQNSNLLLPLNFRTSIPSKRQMCK